MEKSSLTEKGRAVLFLCMCLLEWKWFEPKYTKPTYYKKSTKTNRWNCIKSRNGIKNISLCWQEEKIVVYIGI